MSDEDEPHSAWELAMPFVVCASQGGDYEDNAFVAGFVCGSIDAELTHGHPVTVEYVHPNLIPQLDLIAMRRGYALTQEPWEDDPDTWTKVTFTIVDHDADLDGGLDATD